MDWTEILTAEVDNPRARLAAELLASAAYGSTAARVKAFMEEGEGCRATFFNYRRAQGREWNRKQSKLVKRWKRLQWNRNLAISESFHVSCPQVQGDRPLTCKLV
jgi:hypothetical protein